MTSDKKVIIQQRRIEELEQRVGDLLQENKRLTLELDTYKNSFSEFQDELSRAREIRKGYERALAQIKIEQKEHNDKMAVLLKRLKKQV